MDSRRTSASSKRCTTGRARAWRLLVVSKGEPGPAGGVGAVLRYS